MSVLSRRETISQGGILASIIGTTGCLRLTDLEDGEATQTVVSDNAQVAVGQSDNPGFVPDDLTVSVGTEVTWVWYSTYNIVVDKPEDADWEGTPGDEDRVFEAGYEYSYTFDKPERYRYSSVTRSWADARLTVVK
jgi:plastocyanin